MKTPPINDAMLKTFCREFRKGMLNGQSSHGNCAKVSWALQGYLSYAMSLDTKVYEGDVGEWNHIWLSMPDGRVIDCTADQFNKGKRRYPKVYIGKPLDIHEGGKPYKFNNQWSEQ